MKYSDKLKDPRWQRKRLEIFQRDNFRCQHCGNPDKPLNIHHLIYLRRDPWDYPNHLYQTLCEDCHNGRQELTERITNAVRISLANIPTRSLLQSAQKLCDEAMLEVNL
jgi:5-methylcytosine-specific restriction endonuclease McrA